VMMLSVVMSEGIIPPALLLRWLLPNCSRNDDVLVDIEASREDVIL
jgi:hypothetical protein